jgi:hypothetical protein
LRQLIGFYCHTPTEATRRRQHDSGGGEVCRPGREPTFSGRYPSDT